MKLPVDQELRTVAVTDLDTSFFLEAGAGTGKTRILVDRVVEIVRRGAAEIEEVVVITFTEKAAGELRSRLRDRLQQRMQTADQQEHRRYQEALRRLVSAHIETIHAFASSLLREFPLHAGVDPGFQHLDEVGAQVDFRERWDDWIWSVAGSELAAVERCLTLGMSLATVAAVATILDRFRELSTAAATVRPPPANTLLRDLEQLVDRGDAIANSCSNGDDRCLTSFRELRRAVANVQTAGQAAPPAQRAAALETALHALDYAPRRSSGALPNWTDRDQLERMRDLLQEARELLERSHARRNADGVHGLTRALTAFVGQAARARRREGKLNFEDLLIEARALVAGRAEVRQVLRERIRFLLVDEFQDTDPLQAELVFLLADDGNIDRAAKPDWRQVRLTPGKLFVVGDPKQSIYRFRRADIDTYLAAGEVFRSQPPGQAQVGTVVQNFRSVPEVTTWINATFAPVLRSDAAFPNAQPDYREIHAYRAAATEPRVLLLYPRAPVADLTLAQLRADEADAVARLVTHLVDSEQWQIADDQERPEHRRRIALGDICVLVESRTAVDLFTQALAALGVPYLLDGGRSFFQRQEVRDVAAILRVLDDPSDEVALLAALKSDAFCCTDVELLEYRNAGGAFSIFARTGADDAVGRALERLRELYAAKAKLTLPALVERAVRESLLVEPLLAANVDRQRAANLKLIVERAVQFAANEMDALRPFVRWLVQRQTEGVRETESQVLEIDDDVVRVMTIHSAKGLEFPVVILAKLSAWDGGPRTATVVDRSRAAIEFEVGSATERFRTPGFDAAARRERTYHEAEQARLMYVATTRARDLLVVSAYRSERNPGMFRYLRSVPSWVAAVDGELHQAPGGARVMLDDELPPGRALPAPVRPQFPADLAEQWQLRLEQRREHRRAGSTYVSPSQLTEDWMKYPRETEPQDRSEEDPEQDARDETERALGAAEGAAGALYVGASTARRRGSLVHEVLYRCDLADPGSAEAWTRWLTARHGLPSLAAEVEAYARRILESAGMRRVLAARQVLRELPLAWYDAAGDQYVEGYADLAFEEPAGWVVVDYKTDTGPAPAELVARYRPQVETYRRAVAATGIPVTACGLWLAASGDMHLW